MLGLGEDGGGGVGEEGVGEGEVVEAVEQLLSRCVLGRRDSEFAEQRGEHLMGVEKRIEDQRRMDAVLVELLDQVATERRLARSRLAGDEHEAFAIADPIEKLALRFAVLPRVEDELRVRRQRERLVLYAA